MALTAVSGLGYVELAGDLVSGATMYELERAPVSTGVYVVVETMPFPFFIDTPETGMVPGTAYTYRYRGKILGQKFVVAATTPSITPRSTFPSNVSASTLQSAINATPAGGTLDISPGTYYLDGTVLNNNSKAITLRSVNRDVIISGAKNWNDTSINSSWTSVGSYWRSARTAPNLDEGSITIVDADAAGNYNKVHGWKDGVCTVFKAKAPGTTTLAADEYCYEAGGDKRLRLGGTNPATRFDRVHVCEQTDWWFTNADNVKMEGLSFIDAGSGPFGNPIGNNDRNGMEIRNCQIGFTHGGAVNFGYPSRGAAFSSGIVLEKSLIRNAGVLAIAMLNADGYRVENNTWVTNGRGYYEWRDQGGLSKFVLSKNGTVRYNVSRGTTTGGGLWWDISCDIATASWNKIGNCAGTAGWPEISRQIDLFDSCFYNSGLEDGGPTLHLSSSIDCEVARCLVVGGPNGANSDYGRVWQVTDDSDVRSDIEFGVGLHVIHDNVSDRVATTNNPHHVWSNSLMPGHSTSWNANKWFASNGVYNWLWGSSSQSTLAGWNAFAEVGTDSLATSGEVLALKKWWGITADDSPVGPPGAFSPIRINSGSDTSYTDIFGNIWAPDSAYSGTSFPLFRDEPVSNTLDDFLYQSERYGATFQYAFGVTNDTYTVRLKFSELHWTAAGQRVFDVVINGVTVLNEYDIFADVGANVAVDKVFSVVVSGGTITIAFTTTTDNAKIDAIEITAGRSAAVSGRAGARGRCVDAAGAANPPPEPPAPPPPPPPPGVPSCDVLFGTPGGGR